MSVIELTQSNFDETITNNELVEEQALGAHFRIRSIPTLMIFREGIGIFSQPGSLSGADLVGLLEKAKTIDMDEVRKELENQ